MAGNIPVDFRRSARQQTSAGDLLTQGINTPMPSMNNSYYPPQNNWGMSNYGNQNNFGLDASQFNNWGKWYKTPNTNTGNTPFNYGLSSPAIQTNLQNNPPPGSTEGFDWKGALGSDTFKNSIAALSGALQAYGGYKQLQLSKDMFQFQKDAFERQYGDQMRMVNEDRAAQKATLSSWNR